MKTPEQERLVSYIIAFTSATHPGSQIISMRGSYFTWFSKIQVLTARSFFVRFLYVGTGWAHFVVPMYVPVFPPAARRASPRW